jgi:hypothetical protein
MDLSIEFDPIAQTVEWHAMDLDTEVVDERTLRLEDAEGLRALGQLMAGVVRGRLADASEVAG